jgi:hypothetical protein
MKVTLLFPPQWSPTQSYLSLPSLTGYLRQRGIQVEQRDVNLTFYEYALDPDVLCRNAERRLKAFLRGRRRGDLAAGDHDTYLKLHKAIIYALDIRDRLPWAVSALRTPSAFLDADRLQEMHRIIALSLHVFSLSHRLQLTFGHLRIPGVPDTLPSILSYVQRPHGNPFSDFYEQRVMDPLLRDPPDLVGLSIVGASQVAAGLTLARMVKERLPDCHVTLGGPYLSRLRHVVVAQRHRLAACADSVVLFEGEHTLATMVDSLQRGMPIASVPNVIPLTSDHEPTITDDTIMPLGDIPSPIFDRRQLDRYLAPYHVLPALTSRGCYWGRCAFCTHGHVYRRSYRQRAPKEVVAELCRLHAAHGARHFTLNDECLHPEFVRSLCCELAHASLDFRFLCDCRPEPSFTLELCREMYRVGFRSVYLGIESGSNRVLRKMRKGTTSEEAAVVLRNMADAGLDTNVMLFFGFPTESDEEARETIQFFRRNRSAIQTASATTFQLSEESIACLEPERFGLQVAVRPDGCFSAYLPYEVRAGLSPDRARQWYRRFLDVAEQEGLAPGRRLLDPRTYRFLQVSEAGGAAFDAPKARTLG